MIVSFYALMDSGKTSSPTSLPVKLILQFGDRHIQAGTKMVKRAVSALKEALVS